MKRRQHSLVLALLMLPALVQASNLKTALENTRPLSEGLLIDGIGSYGRRVVHTDAIEYQLLTYGFQEPQAGQTIEDADGKVQTWQSVMTDEHGWFTHKSRGGYLYVTVEADKPKTALIHVLGPSMFYVNAQPRNGNRYAYKETFESWQPNFNFVVLPIQLKAGKNELLFKRTWRSGGRVKAQLVDTNAEVLLNGFDITVPDLVVGQAVATQGALVVVNATDQGQDRLTLETLWPDGQQNRIIVPSIPGQSVRKVAFLLKHAPFQEARQVDLKLRLRKGDKILDEWPLALSVREPGQTRRITYQSKIDGSIQYYALNPAQAGHASPEKPALIFSTHGADVEAINQANSYASKSWCHLVAPTNRRPYGFDWEDWGRMDLLEVMGLAKASLPYDPTAVYLTGHSMGGHGAWINATLFPDRFAATGPSAGWISFTSYRHAQPYDQLSPMDRILQKAVNMSDTLALSSNLQSKGVYILHGGGDRVVKPDQATMMSERLATFHRDWDMHIEPNQGHWWDLDPGPGADCVDWPPMFDFFSRHRLPRNSEIRRVRFKTANPGISSTCHWATIAQQIEPYAYSAVDIDYQPAANRFQGTTNNVKMLGLLPAATIPDQPLTIKLDGDTLSLETIPAGQDRVWLQRSDTKWSLASTPSKAQKGPHRYGPFKEAFQHRMVFVVGTQGTPLENAWAQSKARFDAEQWWYQGNGAVDIIADSEFEAENYPDRSVILYGNAKTNSAWSELLGESPVQVDRKGVNIGKRRVEGKDLACLFLRPRSDSDEACVAVVSGTGVTGQQLTNRLQYFLAGSNLPDCIILGLDMLHKGKGGIRVAGFFGTDWSVEKGDFVWQVESEVASVLPANIGPDPRPFTQPRSYVCQRTPTPLKIDGKLDEAAWEKASWTETFVDIEGTANPLQPRFPTRAKMLWDDTYFYVAAKLEEPHVWGTITKRNSVIFHDNDFEVFIDPDGDGHSYYEFEMNALNTVWNLYLDKPYKHAANAVIREMPGQQSGVYIEGSLNDPTDEDVYWTVEMAFPWAAMAEYAGVPCPPRTDDQWRVNFSRVQWQHRIKDGQYVRVPPKDTPSDIHEDNWVWSPQGVINMHRPETWGLVQFSDQPVGTEPVVFKDDGSGYARYLLSTVLYAQMEHREKTKRYAGTLKELALPEPEAGKGVVSLEVAGEADGFVGMCKVRRKNGTIVVLTVDQDGRFREE